MFVMLNELEMGFCTAQSQSGGEKLLVGPKN